MANLITWSVLLLLVVVGNLLVSAKSSSFFADGLIKAENILGHLNELEQIAQNDKNQGSRSVFQGYNDSVNYVLSQLANTGYDVKLQYFTVDIPTYTQGPVLLVTRPQEVSFRLNTDYLGYNSCGSGNINAQIQIVQGGCSASDFADFIPGRIALLNRGAFSPTGSNVTSCSYRIKVTNANNAGAVGILVYNPDDQLPTLGGCDPGVTAPTFGISSSTATFLIEFGLEVFVNLQAQLTQKTYTTMNILADTPTGRDDRLVVIGSHLDSVPAGPGINDNGSGSATILEIALQFWNIGFNPVNKVRFAWWSAEEWGLLGSYYYTLGLDATELSKHALNLNFDMIGSPNYIRGVYDGRNGPEDVRQASGNIQAVFEEFFELESLTHQSTPFNGRSDYGGFIERGIPAGGLAAGAEEIKTVEQQKLFGGSAYVALDSCYHRACDTVANINRNAIQELGSAAAYTAWTLAMQTDLQAFLQK